MNRFAKTYTLSACALAAAGLLSACGGGDAGAPFGSTATTGYAVDGYLKDASVKCDASGIVVRTDSAGFFRFPDGCSSALTLTGGINQDTLLPFAGTLKAPAGSKMVTPLTTLLVGGMTQDQVNASLGLPAGTDLTNTDPALMSAGSPVHPDLLKKTLAIQQLLMQTTEAMGAFAGDSSDAARQAIYAEVASAFAAGLKGGVKLNATATTVDLVVLNTLVTAAGTRLAASALVPAAVKSALALGMRADTFAAVISGGMKAQAEILLTMANADVKSVTTAQQSDTKVKAAVTATGMSAILVLTPADPAVVAKAKTLTDSITGGGTVIVPPPAVTGTVLTNFDDVLPVGDPGVFGDAGVSIAPAPAGASGAALKLNRSGGMAFGGTYYTVAPAIPFASDRKTISARVYATRANAKIYLKVEAPGGVATEVVATVTVANTWQTLTWVLSGVDPTKSYTTVVVSADTDVASLGAQTYWVDEIQLTAAPPPAVTGTVLTNFDDVLPVGDPGVFGDAGVSIAPAPAGASGAALKLNRSGGMAFGGTYYTVAPAIPFASDRKTISARVYASRANAKIYLKVEVPGGVSTEVAATVTAANTWQTLTWVLSGVDPTKSYRTVVVSADTDVASLGAQTYWVDDIKLADASGGGSGGGTVTPGAVNFEASGSGAAFTWSPFENGDSGGPVAIVANPNSSGVNTSATVARFTAMKTGQPWAGFESKHGSDLGTKTLDATNALVKMKVYKTVLSDVGVKLISSSGASAGEVKVPNTVTGAWQELTFDFCSKLTPSVIDQIAVFPDFIARSSDTVNYLDDITFNACPSTGGGATGGTTGGTTGGGAVSTGPINFEAGGRGAAFTWFAFDNFSDQPVVVGNPFVTGINTSSTVLKFSQSNGAWYTGMESKHGTGGAGSDLGAMTLSAANAVVKMKVYKTLVSDVGVKLVREDGGSAGDVRVPNTQIGQWEELTFNFCSKLSITSIDQVVVFPDFNALDVNHTNTSVSYVDDIVFSACP